MSRDAYGRILACAMAAGLLMAACSREAPPPQSTDPATSSPATPAPAAPAAPQAPEPPQPSEDQPVTAGARELQTMLQRVDEYAALHKELEDRLPKLSNEATPEEIDKNQRALARLIQQNRRNAKPGDIFTPDARTVVKSLLDRVFAGPEGSALRASIMDENPVAVKLSVNGRYPDTVPLSTVPPQVLQGLPKLPEEMEYRFINRHLILMDVHAHLIVDFIQNALPN
jgi:hypothetical protein